MWLVDTSVWVRTFQRGGPAIEQFVAIDDVVTALPIVQEVLQGFRDDHAFVVARESMLAMPIIESPITEALVIEGAELYRAARRAGVTPRSSVDCMIAACAIRHRIPVLHADRDYDALTRVSPLVARNIALST